MKLIVVTEWPLREGWEFDFLIRSLNKEGFRGSEIKFVSVLESRPHAGIFDRASRAQIEAGQLRVQSEISNLRPSVVLACGEGALGACSPEHKGIDKWQASVLWKPEGHAVIPTFSMERVSKDLSLQVWLSLACRKAANPTKEPKYDFFLNPPLAETLSFLRGVRDSGERVSVDIETGRGQINTVGFATSSSRALAFNVLPDRMGTRSFFEIWGLVRDILESDQPKILQNFIYETQFFSRYGILLRGVTHDTMIAQKFLWPELEMGLDAVGRMYTNMPYWKDDGKSWNNIRDWERHYEYNCKDTVGTYAGYLGQLADLRERGLLELYQGYIARLFPCVTEMCSRGLPVSRTILQDLRESVEKDYQGTLGSLRAQVGAESLNPKSPAQVKKFLSSEPRKYAIPKKRDSKTGLWKESSDERSLKKLRMKFPEDPALSHLLTLSKLGKALSSYLSFTYDTDGRMRYSLVAGSTETMRMAGYCDPWGNGVNPQTVPGGSKGINIKSLFETREGYSLLQCDLAQAESRFVAYDSADLNLIRALEDSSRDIHSEVAEEICRELGMDPANEKRDPKEWKKRWRQLGKKSGHSANYSVGVNTFIEACIQEMDLVLTPLQAGKVLGAYHTLFPGIRRWHARIRQEVGQTRKLTTPWGWERYFYSRLDDNLFREAYAFRPQSTVPYIVNQLMLHLVEARKRGAFEFNLLLQCHDSILLEVPDSSLEVIAKACLDTKLWHPKIQLSGGTLIIPTSLEVGRNWGNLVEYELKNEEEKSGTGTQSADQRIRALSSDSVRPGAL